MKKNSTQTSRTLNPNMSAVGGEIREVRKARGLTLTELGKKANCSAAYLSRIERGDTRINVELLEKIGLALEVDPKWFFPSRTGSGELERSYIVRTNNRRSMSELYARPFEELEFSDELISSSFAGTFYMVITTFPPNSNKSLKAEEGYVSDGEQHGLVIEGELELTLGDENIALKPGDSWSFPNTIPHRFCNIGKSKAKIIWASSPVMINW